MAEKPDQSSVFTLLTILIGVLLLAAGGVAWLQGGQSENASPSRAALAGLSQALALHAVQIRNGNVAAAARLATDYEALEKARAAAANVPGARGDWQSLDEGASAIVSRRDALGAAGEGAVAVQQGVPVLLAAADELPGLPGASAALFEFQERARRLGDDVEALLEADEPQPLAERIAADLDYLRSLRAALAGEESNLDVPALADTEAAAQLAALTDALARVDAGASQVLDNAAALAGVEADAARVISAAAALRGPLTAAAAEPRSFITHPWVVPGLPALALLALIVLAVLHAKSAVFERTAKVQAEQNDRNQQAILRLLDELGSLADGDLTVEATVTEDITGAIADSINYAIEKLRELVATINETAIMVDSAAKQTESTAVHMARAAENQNREISAASESIVSMAASIEEVSGNAERSSDVARHSVDVAHKGGEAVRRTIDGMNTIRETIQETSKRIKRLGESSQEIGNIVELINDIAEQTNILALNASIQASMAGEAGRGFAVVADEVQRLAERSTNATKQIEVLVRTIQADTNEAVVSMERSTTDVVGGALLAENAGAALDEIEQVSNQIASLVQNISQSARQQASSAADVTRRTTKLKEISAQTGKATTATAAAISKLSVLASQLRKTVAGFTLPSSALEERKLAAVDAPQAPRAAGDKAAG